MWATWSTISYVLSHVSARWASVMGSAEPELGSKARRSDGETGSEVDPATVAHRHLEAPSTEIEPNDRSGARPNARPLADEAKPSLFGPVQNLDGKADSSLESSDHLGPVGRLAKGRRPERNDHLDVERVESMAQSLRGCDRRVRPLGRNRAGGSEGRSELEHRSTAHQREEPDSTVVRDIADKQDGKSCCRGRRRRLVSSRGVTVPRATRVKANREARGCFSRPRRDFRRSRRPRSEAVAGLPDPGSPHRWSRCRSSHDTDTRTREASPVGSRPCTRGGYRWR